MHSVSVSFCFFVRLVAGLVSSSTQQGLVFNIFNDNTFFMLLRDAIALQPLALMTR
jgi:hypothetical protein